jgi:hypothetical protein
VVAEVPERLIHHGMRPAATNGAPIKNRAEPNTAVAFRMTASYPNFSSRPRNGAPAGQGRAQRPRGGLRWAPPYGVERDGQQPDRENVAYGESQDRLVGPAGTNLPQNKNAAVNLPNLMSARSARKTISPQCCR